MTIDINELRRLAQAAIHPVTKGRWIRLFGERTVYDRMEDGCRGIPVVSTPISPPHPFEAACLDFIAAANPAAITELLDRLEAAEKERDEFKRACFAHISDNALLQAKVAEMEKQSPICRIKDIRRAHYMTKVVGLDPEAWLYALPGAQPAPSVPEGWQLVPTAESRHPGIYKMLGALHAADNTPGMSEWESYRAMIAAAPEAKP